MLAQQQLMSGGFMKLMNRLFARALLIAFTAFSVQAAFADAPTVAPLPDRVAPKKTWTDHTWVSPDGTKFHYVEQGKGTPMILIHGLTSSAVNNWFNPGIAQKLAKTNRVIAIDMRGHGETGPSPADSKGTMIQDIVDFMDYLKIQKAHIGGYSMGGATTAGLLKVAPERFITASVMGIGIKETPEWLDKSPKDPPVAAAAMRAATSASNSAAISPAGNPGAVDLTPRADGAPRGAPKGAPDANPEVDLTKIHFPVLSLNGSNDRPIAKSHRMWRELQDFTYVVIPGRNHMEACRDPLFGDALVRFITATNPR
jgi:pimeloyl-ACP methyl ester carboxylesterase